MLETVLIVIAGAIFVIYFIAASLILGLTLTLLAMFAKWWAEEQIEYYRAYRALDNCVSDVQVYRLSHYEFEVLRGNYSGIRPRGPQMSPIGVAAQRLREQALSQKTQVFRYKLPMLDIVWCQDESTGEFLTEEFRYNHELSFVRAAHMRPKLKKLAHEALVLYKLKEGIT